MPVSSRHRSTSGSAAAVSLLFALGAAACAPSDFDHLMHAVPAGDAGQQPPRDAGSMSTPALDAAMDSGSRVQMDAGMQMVPVVPTRDAGRPESDASVDAGGGNVVMPPEPKHEEDSGTPTPVCPHAKDPTMVQVSPFEAGALVIPPFTADRAGIVSTMVGQRVLWLFTLSGAQMAGWGSRQSLLSSPPHLEEPGPFVPLLPAGTVPDGSEVAIGSVLALNDREAWFFFAATRWFTLENVGLARIGVDQASAQIVRASGELFPQPAVPDGGSAPWRPAFMTGAIAVEETAGNFVYLYACQANPDVMDEQPGGAQANPCRLARVLRAGVAQGASYRYWNGWTWVADVQKASVVIHGVQTELSVSYNNYLSKYLAVHTQVPNSIVLQIADHPWGPWKMLTKFPTMESTAGFRTTLRANEHPELRDACHQVTYVSYVKPWATSQDAGTDLHYETRLMRLQLD
jgi:hypothetical protein